ncbi:hypothetical protein V5799_027847 [Amblyomma americanum]|uniref:Uncharacterized protein n=1 Tax=Amblyomma americanum TaxID=6943 RepID=A0AAQ4DEJ7_AMBAM
MAFRIGVETEREAIHLTCQVLWDVLSPLYMKVSSDTEDAADLLPTFQSNAVASTASRTADLAFGWNVNRVVGFCVYIHLSYHANSFLHSSLYRCLPTLRTLQICSQPLKTT